MPVFKFDSFLQIVKSQVYYWWEYIQTLRWQKTSLDIQYTYNTSYYLLKWDIID